MAILSFPRLLIGLIVATVGESFSTSFVTQTYFASRTVVDTTSRRRQMEMRAVTKRGKARAPPRLRHDYSHRTSERDWNSDQFEPHKKGANGVPAINLFVRGHRTHEWLPCGNVMADETITHLVNYYRDTDSASAKNEIDDIIARSLAGAWEAGSHLDETIFNVYPRLRQGDLEYGYKISHENMTSEQKKMSIITQKILHT